MAKPIFPYPEWVTAAQAAAMLGVHVDTIRRWERSGKLPPSERTPTRSDGKPGRRRYRREDIVQLVAERAERAAEIAVERVQRGGDAARALID